ncbi:hypothetical protein Tco_1055252 [Tanacetum coccineum]|uniref:Uncharacterized protein n=1 Tax=Tanacetum coccineum TaxID=301880 RepID=A0ABQ5H0J1_9ASTR
MFGSCSLKALRCDPLAKLELSIPVKAKDLHASSSVLHHHHYHAFSYGLFTLVCNFLIYGVFIPLSKLPKVSMIILTVDLIKFYDSYRPGQASTEYFSIKSAVDVDQELKRRASSSFDLDIYNSVEPLGSDYEPKHQPE